MVGAGEDNAFDVVLACGFLDMKHAANVAFENFLERPLDRYPTKMRDGIDAFAEGMYGGFVGEVTGHYLFVRASSGLHRGDIGKANDIGVRAKRFA